VIEGAQRHHNKALIIEQVLEADAWARSYAEGWVKAKA
jgi:hypothetical protein